MRYFLSTGEASGELNATLLARAIRDVDPDASFEGIGGERMRSAGIALFKDHTGWASMGPLAAIPRIPYLLTVLYVTAFHIKRTRPDAVVLVDFGAFNVRLAKTLARIRYRRPVIDWFPPAAWLDDEKTARAVAAVAVPLTAFERQRRFYESLGLPVAFFGHPLAGQYEQRDGRPPAPADGGTVAILPGSRSGELHYHLPRLFEALRLLRERRPNLRVVAGAADERAERALRDAVAAFGARDISIVRGTQAAIRDADAAWVASGTAVLETFLSGVPAVALYVISPALVRHARRVYRGKYITLPNLILEREVVPELLQEAATPPHLAQAMEETLRDPQRQYREIGQLRAALGPADALERCAAFVVATARSNA